MTVDELVGYFVAHEDMIAKDNRTKEIVRAMNKNPSLALKANVTQSKAHEASKEERVDENLEEEEEMTSTSELDTNLTFFAKKYGKHSMKRGSFIPKEKKRSCYNCNEPGHIADTCPYEKRQDKPKYAKGVKPKLKPNPINLRNKKSSRTSRLLLVLSTPPMLMKRILTRRPWSEWPAWLLPSLGHYSNMTTPRTMRASPRTLLINALWQRRLR
jgi:hypothetical protein